MGKPKRKLTAAERRAKRERKKKYMFIFLNGRQKRVLRPQTIDGMSVEEFICRNADPIWLHMNGMWEYMPIDDLEHSDECLPEAEIQTGQEEWEFSSEVPF